MVGSCIHSHIFYRYDFFIHAGYERVLCNLVDITIGLKVLPRAHTQLTQLYQQNRWLDITDKPNADELVKLALGRIKVDPNQYDLFIAMLQGITGMENIAHKVTSGESD